MIRNWTRTGGVLGLLAIAFLPSSAAAGPGALRKIPPRPIESIAMDGPRLAYDLRGEFGHCNVLYVWNMLSGAVTRISGKDTCDADNSSTGFGVREIAVAGTRLAWVISQGGNSKFDEYLSTASLRSPKEHRLAAAISGDEGGKRLGCVVGSGKFLAVNRWVENAQGTATSARLQRIRTGLQTIASGTDAIYARSTDGREVAVLRDQGSVGLYSTAGKLLRMVTPAPPPLYAQCRAVAQGVALRGDYLAVLTGVGWKSTLVVYNSHSGKLLHSWPMAKGASYLAVSSGLAAYAAFRGGGGGDYALRTVHVLNLSTGKDRVVVSIAPGAPGVVGLQLEPLGLAYAVDHTIGGGPGLVVFKPMAQLR